MGMMYGGILPSHPAVHPSSRPCQPNNHAIHAKHPSRNTQERRKSTVRCPRAGFPSPIRPFHPTLLLLGIRRFAMLDIAVL